MWSGVAPGARCSMRLSKRLGPFSGGELTQAADKMQALAIIGKIYNKILYLYLYNVQDLFRHPGRGTTPLPVQRRS